MDDFVVDPYAEGGGAAPPSPCGRRRLDGRRRRADPARRAARGGGRGRRPVLVPTRADPVARGAARARDRRGGARPIPEPTVAPELVGRIIPLGLVDDPEHQDQYPVSVDLEEGGGLLVFGAGGSGRTTLLRTHRHDRGHAATPDDLVIFGIDFASRALRSIEPLPHVAAVGTGDDLESVTRILALLQRDRATQGRAGRAAGRDADRLPERGGRLPRVLLLIDGFPSLVGAFSGSSSTFGASLDQWLELTNRCDPRRTPGRRAHGADRRPPGAASTRCSTSAVANKVDPAPGGGGRLRATTASRWRGPGVSTSRPGAACGRATGWCRSPPCPTRPTVPPRPQPSARLAASFDLPAGTQPALRTAPLPELVELTPEQRRADGPRRDDRASPTSPTSR